jgi:hypothetical protein
MAPLASVADITNSCTSIRLPALCVRVTCTASVGPSVAAGSAAAPRVALLSGPAMMPLPLPADAVLLSSVHPSADFACSASRQNDGIWTLAKQEVQLERASTHPLALVVPGIRLKVLMASGAGTPDRLGYNHVFSCSVPLAVCFKDLLASNLHTLQRPTLEDGMQYQVHVALDTRGMSLAAVQEAAAEMQRTVDVLLHHQSAVAQSLGLPALKTVDELVAEVDEHKERRAAAVSTVLTALSAGDQATSMLDLQYGRAFGMRVDQQQCRALREGSVLGHGFEQTLLHASVAQASLIAKIAQEAGVSTHDPLRVQSAVENFVHTQGLDALVQCFAEKMQDVYCSRTQYQFDPAFAASMNIARAVQNADGSLTLNVVPQLALQQTPGEDQNLTPGVDYADLLSFFSTNGLMRRDCEDGAHTISACFDLFRCAPAQQLIARQSQLLQQLPIDVQKVGSTLLYISSQLHMHAAQAEHAHSQAALVALGSVTPNLVAKKASTAQEFSRTILATSLLAASPKLDASFASNTSDPTSKLECSAKEYNSWWTGALSSGDSQCSLNGHSVAISAGLAPLFSIAVPAATEQTRVEIHLLDPSLRVFESTAPARQLQQADTKAVKLDVSKAPLSEGRRMLQQRLDKCGPLTQCMACNVRSSLNTQETKMLLTRTLQAAAGTTTGAPSAEPARAGNALAGIPSGPSIVPMQAFSLRTEAATEQELARQVAFGFYKTLLSCGRGVVFTLDMANGGAFAGMPMARQLKNTPAIVVGSPIQGAELRNLRVLGALQSSFVLPAADALANIPPLMPLALQQRMKLCPMRQQLVPLTPAELRQAQHACGMLAQTALIAVPSETDTQGARAEVEEHALANMRALHSATQQVVGPSVHATGGPFAESVFLTFA